MGLSAEGRGAGQLRDSSGGAVAKSQLISTCGFGSICAGFSSEERVYMLKNCHCAPLITKLDGIMTCPFKFYVGLSFKAKLSKSPIIITLLLT